MYNRYGSFIVGLLLGAALLQAQATAAAPSASPSPSPTPLRTIGNVKVTGASASRSQQQHSAFSGSLLNRKAIRELGAGNSMQSVLSSKPSVQVSGFGGTPYVRTHFSFRGFNGGEFGETLDGIPLNGLFNGGVTNSASQRNATPFVTDLLSSINIYRGVNDPQHTSIDSLGGSVAYHLVDPTLRPSYLATYNVGHGGDFFAQTGSTVLGGTRFAIGLGSDYYRGFQSDVPDQNRYVYVNGIVPLPGRNFLRVIYSDDKNVGYVPHDVPLADYTGFTGYSIADNGIGFQWPANQTYSFNTADVNLDIIDFTHGWSPAVTSRFTLFRYDTRYHRLSYTNPNYYYLPNSPFAPTFAQPWMNGTISSSAADFAYHRYVNSDQRLGYVFRTAIDTSTNNTVVVGTQYEHGYEESAEYWGSNPGFKSLDTVNDAWNQPGYRNSSVLYAEDRLHLGNLLINPGLRLDSVQTADYTPVVGYFYSLPFAVGNSYNFTEPSVGMRYTLPGHVVAYAGYGVSAKPPEISAYYNDVLDPYTNKVAPLVVQPEKSRDLDLGLRGRVAGGYWSVDTYDDRFVNTFSTSPATYNYYIGLGETPGQANSSVSSGAITLTTNAGNAEYKGVELGLSHVLLRQMPSGNLYGFFNFSQNSALYTSAYTSASGSSVTVGTVVPYVPNHLWNMGLDFRGRRTDFRIGEHVVGAQGIFDDTTGAPANASIGSYTSLNAYLAYDLDPAGRTQIALSGTNLFNDSGLVYSYVSSSFADANGNTVPVQVGMPLGPPTVYMSISERM